MVFGALRTSTSMPGMDEEAAGAHGSHEPWMEQYPRHGEGHGHGQGAAFDSNVGGDLDARPVGVAGGGRSRGLHKPHGVVR